MTDLPLYGYFSASGVAKTGLTPTVMVRQVNRATGAASLVVNGGSTVEVGDGWYRYLLANADLAVYDYPARMITADTTVDAKNVPCGWTDYVLSHAGQLAYLDALISSRLAAAGYTAPPAVSAVADAVWDESMAGHAGAGTAGAYLALTGRLGSGPITVAYPMLEDQTIVLYEGDDYTSALGRALAWEDADGAAWPDLTGATVELVMDGAGEYAATVVQPSGEGKRVECELTGAQTALMLGDRNVRYQVKATVGGGVVTLADGRAVIRRKVVG